MSVDIKQVLDALVITGGSSPSTVTWDELRAMVTDKTVVNGQQYDIIPNPTGTSIQTDLGIKLFAGVDNTLSRTASGGFLNADFQGVSDYSRFFIMQVAKTINITTNSIEAGITQGDIITGDDGSFGTLIGYFPLSNQFFVQVDPLSPGDFSGSVSIVDTTIASASMTIFSQVETAANINIYDTITQGTATGRVLFRDPNVLTNYYCQLTSTNPGDVFSAGSATDTITTLVFNIINITPPAYPLQGQWKPSLAIGQMNLIVDVTLGSIPGSGWALGDGVVSNNGDTGVILSRLGGSMKVYTTFGTWQSAPFPGGPVTSIDDVTNIDTLSCVVASITDIPPVNGLTFTDETVSGSSMVAYNVTEPNTGLYYINFNQVIGGASIATGNIFHDDNGVQYYLSILNIGQLYTANDIVIAQDNGAFSGTRKWKHYINTSGNNTKSPAEAANPDWLELPMSTDSGMVPEWRTMEYDFPNNEIIWQRDQYNNEVGDDNQFSFPFGNINVSNNKVGNNRTFNIIGSNFGFIDMQIGSNGQIVIGNRSDFTQIGANFQPYGGVIGNSSSVTVYGDNCSRNSVLGEDGVAENYNINNSTMNGGIIGADSSIHFNGFDVEETNFGPGLNGYNEVRLVDNVTGGTVRVGSSNATTTLVLDGNAFTGNVSIGSYDNGVQINFPANYNYIGNLILQNRFVTMDITNVAGDLAFGDTVTGTLTSFTGILIGTPFITPLGYVLVQVLSGDPDGESSISNGSTGTADILYIKYCTSINYNTLDVVSFCPVQLYAQPDLLSAQTQRFTPTSRPTAASALLGLFIYDSASDIILKGGIDRYDEGDSLTYDLLHNGGESNAGIIKITKVQTYY